MAFADASLAALQRRTLTCAGLQGLSFSESVWMTCHTIMISLTMGLRYVPHKLAPSIFPRACSS